MAIVSASAGCSRIAVVVDAVHADRALAETAVEEEAVAGIGV